MQPTDPKPPTLTAFDVKSPAAQLNERLSHPYDPAQFRKTHRLDESEGMILENPTDRVVSCICHLHSPKPPPRSSSRRADDDDDDEPDARYLAAVRAAQIASAVKITFQPKERKWIPNSLISALVLIRDGVVCGGQMPMLRAPGEALAMHPSLLETDGEAAPFAIPTRTDRHFTYAVSAPKADVEIPPVTEHDGGADDPLLARKRATK